MELENLIKHPEMLDRDTLYELRSMLALYPYFQTARLLMLKNLYLLHDSSFDEELRKAAIYITDRKVIFAMIEAAHYTVPKQPDKEQQQKMAKDGENRTLSLIDNFLDTVPKENQDTETKKERRKATPADATIDYVAYLLESEADSQQQEETPQMVGQELIDSFINTDKNKIVLSEEPQLRPEVVTDQESSEKESEESYFTETLARIYIKQGRYSKALEIIQRLSLDNPKKNAYFADQIRFIKKLIINNNKNKK